jgi:hemoglobin/transferrin/lactoferrin receptor protein
MKKITIILLLSTLYLLNIFAQIDSVSLNEVLISVNRTGQSKGRVGQQVTVLSKRDIQFFNPQTAAHALEQTGQVLIQRSQAGGGSPIIRGFEANKVLLVIDGVRMNNAIYRGGHLQNIITIDPNMLERTEVLFGSNSLMYGSDALGGVMYFQTRKPELATDENLNIGGNAMIRYSSAFDEKTANAVLNIGTKRIASLTSFTYSDFGDLRTGKHYNDKYGDWGKRTFYIERIDNVDIRKSNDDVSLQIGTAYSQYDILQKFLFKQKEGLNHSLNLQFSNSSDIPRYDRLNELRANGEPRQAEWYYGPQKRFMAAYHFDLIHKTPFSDKIHAVAAFQDIEESRYTRSWGSISREQRIENVTVTSLNVDIEKTFDRQTLNYGIEIQHNDVASSATALNVNDNTTKMIITRYPDGGSQMLTLAAYANVKRELSSSLDISAGLRYAQNSLHSKFDDRTFYPSPIDELKQNYGALVGSLGLTFHSKNGFLIAPSISSAYRAPNVDDVAKVFESVAGRLIIPNPSLTAERTVTFELNLAKSFREKHKIQVVPYFTSLTNALSLVPTKLDGMDSVLYEGKLSGVYSTQNLDEANIYGIFANIQTEFYKNFTFSASYTYTKGSVLNEKGNTPLDHIPPIFGRIGIDYQNKGFRVSLYTLFNGEKKSEDYRLGAEDNEVYSADAAKGYMPSWYTLNLRTSYNIKHYATIQVGLENILNQHYRVFASGVSGAGRNLSITLRSKF